MPAPLILSPMSAQVGEVTSLTLTAQNIDFSRCSIANDALVFRSEKGTQGDIVVESIARLLYEPMQLRAYISVKDSASVGMYAVSYQCDSKTEMSGKFTVDSVPAQMPLTVEPENLAAGSFGKILRVSTPDPFFSDMTEFFFGEGGYVQITHKRPLYDTDDAAVLSRVMELVVDVDARTPLDDIVIMAVNAGSSAEGILKITDRVETTLAVLPSAVERQSDIAVYEIVITGDGIDFTVPDPDAGAVDPDATVIEFPDNPGITAFPDFTVVEKTGEAGVTKELHAQIRVESSAVLGITPLYVKTGTQQAWTSFSLVLPPNTPLLRVVSPNAVPKNGVRTRVFLEAVNFSFTDENFQIYCLEGLTDNKICRADNLSPLLDKNISMDVTVSPALPGSVIHLEAVLADGTKTQASLDVFVPESVTLVPNVKTIPQSALGSAVRLTWSDKSKFKDTDQLAVQVLPRSGLVVTGVSLDVKLEWVTVTFNVADDAPTGPAYIAVTVGDKVYEVPLRIEAKAAGAYMVLNPEATLRKRDTVQVEITGVGNLVLPDDASRYSFDDPGLQIIEMVEGEDPTKPNLSVNVSPLARNDMSVLYVKNPLQETWQAAATFRTLDYKKTEILYADQSELLRPSGPQSSNYTLVVNGNGMVFDYPVVDVSNNIGVSVQSPSVSGDNLVFDLLVDPIGAGGWVGLNIKNAGRNYVVPIFIDAPGGPVDGLTTQMNPSVVAPGTLLMTATLPSGMKLGESALEIRSGHPRAFASTPSILTDRSVTFTLDVAADAEKVGGKQIPIYVVTPDGSGLGYVEISDVASQNISNGETWNGTWQPETSAYFWVENPGPWPAFFQAEFEGATPADPDISMLTDNSLDSAGKAENGLLWMFDEGRKRLEIATETGAESATVTVESRGAGSEGDISEETDPVILSQNPCTEPYFSRGVIDGALDVDTVYLDRPACRLVAFAKARSLSAHPWETPDLKMAYFDTLSGTGDPPEKDKLIGTKSGYLGSDDPLININTDFIAENRGVAVTIQAELGSAGMYLVQIRRPFVIREFSRNASGPFVEFEIPTDMRFELCELVLYDTENDEEIDRLLLSEVLVDDELDTDGTLIENDAGVKQKGMIVIAGMPIDGADAVHDVALLPTTGSFAILLYYEGDPMDVVQLGEGTVTVGDGTSLIATDDRDVFFRIANIDTNDNEKDFAPTFFATPGT